jgi:hypothetical protein
MRDNLKHFPVNWIDGMKISKEHFIATDDAWKDALFDMASVGLSPLRYGILPSSSAGEDPYNVKIALDNQNSLRVTVISCQAITPGGVRIAIPSLSVSGQPATDGVPATVVQLSAFSNDAVWWVVLVVHPYDKQPIGAPDLEENPPRLPYVMPSYTIQVVPDAQFRQYANHPYAVTLGKVVANGGSVRVEDEYIPPCISISASPDLVGLHSELDKFLGTLELQCSQIVQKIYVKKQQNDISELVLFLCDRIMLHLGTAITNMRWTMLHESPAALFATIASLARVMKNTIDLRIGSGKEEMMNYFSEWCELKQGELESMLATLASLRFDNNDINANIKKIITFVKVTTGLFETLGKLEFIGKKRETGIFVTEGGPSGSGFNSSSNDAAKARRRFFG